MIEIVTSMVASATGFFYLTFTAHKLPRVFIYVASATFIAHVILLICWIVGGYGGSLPYFLIVAFVANAVLHSFTIILAIYLFGKLYGSASVTCHYNSDLRIAIAELNDEIELRKSTLQDTINLRDTITNSSPDAIWAKDKEGRYRYVNKAFCDWTMLTFKDIIGCTDAEIRAIVQQQRVSNKKWWLWGDVCCSSDDVVYDFGAAKYTFLECAYRCGDLQYLIVNKALWRDLQEAVIGTVGIGRDVTDRVNISEEFYKRLRDYAEECRPFLPDELLGKFEEVVRSARSLFDRHKYPKVEYNDK